MPLFPRYGLNQSGEEWPVQPRLLKIRGWVRAQGFQPAQALKAEVGGGVYLRVSVYQDAAALIRVQATFLPQSNGAIIVCYSLSSVDAEGSRLVTDNLYIPFGGFYPGRLAGGAPARGAAPCRAACSPGTGAGWPSLPPSPFAGDAPWPTSILLAARARTGSNTELGFLHPPA